MAAIRANGGATPGDSEPISTLMMNHEHQLRSTFSHPTSSLRLFRGPNQMYMDIHIHYFTAAEALNAIDNLTDETGAPWTPPAWRICLEVGPKADYPDPQHEHEGDAWWTDGEPRTNKQILNQFFFSTDGDPVEKWEDFIRRWESQSGHWNPQGQEAGFRIDDILMALAAAEFNASAWTTLQYNKGTDGNPSPHLVDAMRATQVRSGSFFENGNGTDRFTPILDNYLELGAAPWHKIDPFTPHESACAECETCPGCCQ